MSKNLFLDSLERTNQAIRSDRAKAIHDSTKRYFERQIEDIKQTIVDLEIDRNSMLDFADNNVYGIISKSDFNAQKFIDKEINIGIKLRNANIKLEIAQNRYNELFGGK